jgi:hypothetical protein
VQMVGPFTDGGGLGVRIPEGVHAVMLHRVHWAGKNGMPAVDGVCTRRRMARVRPPRPSAKPPVRPRNA